MVFSFLKHVVLPWTEVRLNCIALHSILPLTPNFSFGKILSSTTRLYLLFLSSNPLHTYANFSISNWKILLSRRIATALCSSISSMFMGSCLSASVKAQSHSHNGLNSKVDGRQEDVLSGLSSKAICSYVLLTSSTEGEILQSGKLKCFTFNEVKTATRNFRPASKVGNGWRESVFKGWIDEHTLAPTKPGTGFVIAVKRFIQWDCHGHSEWLTKINYLGQLHHPNLVKLIGYCLEDIHYILISEFVANGSLDDHLFRRSSCFQPLSWKVRMKIALDAAKGLAFLQCDEVTLIHGDFKPSNILIDSNYNAKLSDFGLYGQIVDFHEVTTDCSHAAPEVAMTGFPKKESDVYSFGVVLLEIMSGKRAFDKDRPPGERHLVKWAKPLLINKHEISQVMDAHVKGQYSMHEAMEVAHIAIQCLSSEPKFRPNIDEVVRSLEQLQDSKDTVGGVGSSQSQGQNIKESNTRVAHLH